MSDNALGPLNAAVAARLVGRQPTAAQLAFAAKHRWPHGYDLSTWNTFGGSQNIPIYAAVAFADWPFMAAVARIWKAEGLFGTELGCDNDFYSSGIITRAMLPARRELLKAMLKAPGPGPLGDAEDVRLAVRAHLGWLALAAIPVSRMRDELVTGAGIVRGVRPLPRPGRSPRSLAAAVASRLSLPGLAVAPAGNRYHPGKGGATTLTSDDAGSELLAAAISNPTAYALTLEEGRWLGGVVNGNADAAREVVGWCFGTVAGWRFTARRTTAGAERVFWGDSGATSGQLGPNPNKPCRSVGQVTPDGVYRGLQPSARNTKGWSAGYEVTWVDSVANGRYLARCAGGEADIQMLSGEVLWTVEIDGPEVRFS